MNFRIFSIGCLVIFGIARIHSERLCGKRAIEGDGLVKWPWVVAIFERHVNTAAVKFKTSGTLISEKHILTAALPFPLDDDKNVAGSFLAVLGHYDLAVFDNDELSEEEKILRAKAAELSEILLHPEWTADKRSRDADIAIAVLAESVVFSKKVYPACLPELNNFEVNSQGTIVGWGRDFEDTLCQLQKKASLLIVNNTNCELPEQSRMFCGQIAAMQCSAGRGSGFFKRNQLTTSWVVEGVASGNSDGFKSFISVVRFIEWINNVIDVGTMNLDARLLK